MLLEPGGVLFGSCLGYAGGTAYRGKQIHGVYPFITLNARQYSFKYKFGKFYYR